jgi:hypothetical protein
MARSKTGGGVGTNQHAIKGASLAPPTVGTSRAAALDDPPVTGRAGRRSANIVGPAELAGVALAAARRRLAAAEQELAAARQQVRDAEHADLKARAVEVTANFEAAQAAARAAAANYWALRATNRARPGTTADSLQPRIDAASAIFLADRAVSELRPQVMAANGWRWDNPRLNTRDDDDGDRAWGGPSINGHDEQQIQNYLRIIEAAPDRQFPELWEAIKRIEDSGYRDGQGMPCPHCLSPMVGYNDDEYYCRSCH